MAGGSSGGGGPALPPRCLSVTLAVALGPLPLPAPWSSEACPALVLPIPSATGNLVPIPFPSQAGAEGRGWVAVKGVQGSVLRPHPPYPQNKATGSASLSSSVPSPASVLPGVGTAWGQGGERAARSLSGAVAPLPQCILPLGGCFQGFFKAADSNLATVEKLTKSFHAVHGSLSLSFLLLKRKTQKDASGLCK